MDVEIAPGVILQTVHGLTEFLEGIDEEEDEQEERDRLAEALSEGLAACRPRLEHLGDTLHELRARARRIVAEWQRDGAAARLVDVQLAPYDHWRGSEEPGVCAILEGPGEDLRPMELMVPAQRPCDLEHELAEILPDLAQRSRTQAELTAKGASGYVDQLALNAIAASADTGATLRQLGDGLILELADGTTALTIHAGHVGVVCAEENMALDSISGRMAVNGLFLPQSRLTAGIGRPAAELHPHPLLSDDITVLEASTSFEEGLPGLVMILQIPRRLFCAVTGRVWEDEEGRPDHKDNVVALHGRR